MRERPGGWFAVWDGYGWIWGNILRLTISTDPSFVPEPPPGATPLPNHVRDGARARLPQRSYLLYTGPVDDALTLNDINHPTYGAVPDLWWPSDHTWFIGSDTDLTTTYLGGPQPVIDHLLADTRLETQAVTPHDRLS